MNEVILAFESGCLLVAMTIAFALPAAAFMGVVWLVIKKVMKP